MMKKKKYEAPVLSVTEIETKDVITASFLIGQDILDKNELLGNGTITWIEIDIN